MRQTGLELGIQSGKATFKKGTFRKGQEVLTFFFWGGGHPRPFKKGTNSNSYYPMGHIHRITTGHQGHKKKGHLFLALCVQIFGRASRPFLRASEAMALD